jgi:hypothetical protein
MESDIAVKLWKLDIFHRGLGRSAEGRENVPEEYVCLKEPQVLVAGRVTTIRAIVVNMKTGERCEESFTLSGLPFTFRREEYWLDHVLAEKLGVRAPEAV